VWLGVRGDVFGAGVEEVVDLAGEIAFQAADGLEFGVAFGGLLRDVGLGSRVDLSSVISLARIFHGPAVRGGDRHFATV